MFNEHDRKKARELSEVFADRALSMRVHAHSLPKNQRRGTLREYERLSDAVQLLDKIVKEDSK